MNQMYFGGGKSAKDQADDLIECQILRGVKGMNTV